MLIGLTGFVGVLLKVVGPLTVVPTLLLLGIELYGVMNTFCDPHWGVSAAYVNKYMYNYDKINISVQNKPTKNATDLYILSDDNNCILKTIYQKE